MNNEIELKLRLNATELPLLEKALDCSPFISYPTLKLLNRYFDTPEMGLSQSGAALRIRQQAELDDDGLEVNSRIIQTLKTRGSSTAGLHQRMEWDWPLTEVRLDLRYLRNSEANNFLSENLNLESISPLFTTDFQRKVWMYKHNGTVIELVLDQGRVSTDEHGVDLLELELELKHGQPEVLFELAKEIADQCPVVMSDISKAERGYGLLSLSEKYQGIKKDWSGKFPDCDFNQETIDSLNCFKIFFAYQLSIFQRSLEHSIWDKQQAYRERAHQQLLSLDNLMTVFESDVNSVSSIAQVKEIRSKIADAKNTELNEVTLNWGQLTLLCGAWLFELTADSSSASSHSSFNSSAGNNVNSVMSVAAIEQMRSHIEQLKNSINSNKNNIEIETLSKGKSL